MKISLFAARGVNFIWSSMWENLVLRDIVENNSDFAGKYQWKRTLR